MTRNLVDLQDEILTKIDGKFNGFKIAIIAEIRKQIKQEVSETLENESKKRKELESTVCMLQERVKNYHKQVHELKASQDELEQYGRWLCIRIDGVPVAESSYEIPNVAIDRTHRISKAYTDKTTGVKCKSIIVRFTTFRHRIMFTTTIGRI